MAVDGVEGRREGKTNFVIFLHASENSQAVPT
jgi:hypothetical protein